MVCLSVTIVSCAKTAEAIELPFEFMTLLWPKELCRPITWGPDSPWEGATLVDGSPIVKYRHCRELCKNGWTDRFAVLVVDSSGRMHKCNRIHQVAAMWEDTLPPLGEYNWTTIPVWRRFALSVGWLEFNVPFQHKYGYIRDDRLMSNYFDNLLSLDTPTYTVAQIAERFESRIVYCRHSTQYSHLVLQSAETQIFRIRISHH